MGIGTSKLYGDALYNQWQRMIYNVTEDSNEEEHKKNINNIKTISENVIVEQSVEEDKLILNEPFPKDNISVNIIDD